MLIYGGEEKKRKKQIKKIYYLFFLECFVCKNCWGSSLPIFKCMGFWGFGVTELTVLCSFKNSIEYSKSPCENGIVFLLDVISVIFDFVNDCASFVYFEQ